MDDLLAGLNPEQRAAVTHRGGPLLVLAGAGSGKTRVIVHRIASLVREGEPPWSILAVTFTNKAAGEMRERVEELLGSHGRDVWVSTFHSAGAQILRREGAAVGLAPGFTIYDEDDQLALAKRILREANREADSASARDFLGALDRAKNGVAEGAGPGDLPQLAERYRKALRAANAVDFGDLLALPVELFEKNPDVLARWRRRVSHVLVDEFQDTNLVQFRLLELLAPSGTDLCVVGDDDQSIYRWRGADVGHILGFEQNYEGAAVVKLERNYRSDGNILAAAQAVIEKNRHRHEKRLWTEAPAGERIALVWAQDERDEADRIAQGLADLHERGLPWGEMAVFYRINAQSRVLEEGMRIARIPYVIVRGRSFYDRAEIKDAVAYLRLMVNPRSDVDLLRVVNSPPRGLGETTIERLTRHASGANLCLFDALAPAEVARIEGLNAGARGRLVKLRVLLDGLVALGATASAGDAAEAAIQRTGLLARWEQANDPDAIERAENLRELVGAASEMDARFDGQEREPGEARGRAAEPDRELGGAGGIGAAEPQGRAPHGPPNPADLPEGGTLLRFLEEIALLGEADGDSSGERVSLMTLHAAKGLEFDAVAIAGLEDGIVPHSRALGFGASAEEMAEERRLCYVGFTRARHHLLLSCARARALFGDLRFNAPSRFLEDVPRELFDRPVPAREAPPWRSQRSSGISVDYSYDQSFRPSGGWRPARRAASRPSRTVELEVAPTISPVGAVGMRVRHAVFGVGRVVAADGEGPDAKLTVNFPSAGNKRIVARFVTPV